MYSRLSRLFFLLVFSTALLPLRAQEEPKIVVPATYIDPAPPVVSTDPLLIQSWNIGWFPTTSPTKPGTAQDIKKRIEEVAQFLRKEKPTILFACEIQDLESLKAMKLDYPYIACSVVPRTADENPTFPLQSVAFMSKVPWKEVWVLDFSEMAETADKPSRGIIGAEFDIPNLGKLTLYGVHLKSNRGGIEASSLRRQRAVTYIAEDFKRRGLDPKKDFIMIMGDYNTAALDPAFASDLTLKMIKDLGFVSAAEGMSLEKAGSFRAEKKFGANDLDHIMVSEGLQAKIKTPLPWMDMVAVGDNLSDHNPIFLPLGKLLGTP